MEPIQAGEQPLPEASRHTRLPWAIFAVLLAMLGITIWISDENGTLLGDEAIFIVFAITAIVAYEVVGAVVASRAPRNPIGWLLLAVGFTFQLGALSDELSTFAYHEFGTDALVFKAAIWTQTWLFAGITALPFLLLLFPDGRPPGPRWRPVVWFTGIATVLLGLTSMFMPGRVEVGLPVPVDNPLGIDVLEPVLSPLQSVANIAMILATIASVVAIIVRWRRAIGVERRQIRILALTVLTALVFFATTALAAELGGDRLEDLSSVLFLGFFAVVGIGIPVALGFSILRYRMYDLELVIRKTVRFAIVAVSILLIAAAVLLVAGSTLMGGIPSGDAGPVLGLLLGVLVAPLWRLSRRVADRLVFGGRATPYEVLTEFSERMGESYTTDDVLPRMASILGNAVGAERADVWLGTGSAQRRAAGWPDDAGPASPGRDTVEVSYQGDVLGALSVQMPANDPMDESKRSLLHDLASQAGPVLHNVRLLEDLRESRRRIVSAQDERARKLERDIHDGVQQQLVALAVKLRLADQLIDRDPARAHEAMATLQLDASHALDDLRDLARGIYPPLLADQGLEAALTAQARKAAVPTTVTTHGIGRFPSDVEAAVYFCTLEALNNAAKYADATAVTVSLERSNGHLTFKIADDGQGFDPAVTNDGTGLQGMRDRIDAVGGHLRIDAAPGRGVAVTATLPAEEP